VNTIHDASIADREGFAECSRGGCAQELLLLGLVSLCRHEDGQQRKAFTHTLVHACCRPSFLFGVADGVPGPRWLSIDYVKTLAVMAVVSDGGEL
jgi:hypothetical protein